MAFVLLSRSRSQTQGSVRPGPKLKSARGQHSADLRFGFAQLVFQPPTTALPTAPVIQTKLKIGEPNDKYEQAADRVADEIMRLPDSEVQHTHGEEDSDRAQPAGSFSGILAGSDKPLPGAVRSYFEPRFGHDFSRVRVHMDLRAAHSAGALGARAYTLGHDVVLGEGQYAPETREGRRLLAHELAHVVQQSSGGIDPMIQRRLLVTGDKADIQAFLGLLEPASGFTLKHDPKSKPRANAVSITGSVLKPPSSVLASRLWSIIDDPNQDAEIHLGRTQSGVDFGKFPTSAQNLVQEIRIDQVLALEKGAPGSGVATLAHEIVENYEGHALKNVIHWALVYGEAHERALEPENLIQGELGYPGSRRNTFFVEIDPGKGKPRFLRRITDQEKYFLVWDTSFDAKGIVSNSRRVPRVKVSTYKIDGFTAGSDSLPKAGEVTITALTADLKKNPTASTLVEGFAAAGSTSAENLKLATKWAEMVRDKVIDEGADKLTINWRRFHVVGSAAQAGNSVVITVERPDM